MENITQRTVNKTWFKCFIGWLCFQTLLFGVAGWILALDVVLNGSHFSYTRQNVDYQHDYESESIEPIKKNKR